MSTAPTQATTASLPRINDTAPDFEAKSTQGPLKLSDYKGKWVVLFSHPADFTPVCTTEFVEFARRSEEFKERGAQLVEQVGRGEVDSALRLAAAAAPAGPGR